MLARTSAGRVDFGSSFGSLVAVLQRLRELSAGPPVLGAAQESPERVRVRGHQPGERRVGQFRLAGEQLNQRDPERP